jgi:hypothetical protein
MPSLRLHQPITALALLTAACTDPSQSLRPDSAPPLAQPGEIVCKPAPPDELILLPIAPRSKRVDLTPPVFSRPTEVTNPLFPIANLEHAVLVGLSDGEPFRAETTLLPSTKTIRLESGPVEVLVSQYVAFLDGRLHEVALDWYAQADDGSVWYFGEDVFNYEDGKVVDTDGSWISCEDGPPAMIMPGHPRVGDVFRVENIYPFVFEEVEVIAVGLTVAGPLGPVAGALTVQELHLDGSYASKTFAPGYGEFSTGADQDIEALAVAVPTDNAGRPTPSTLTAILDGADEAFEAAGEGNWRGAEHHLARIEAGWRGYRAQGAAPLLLGPLMTEAIAALTVEVRARDREEARQAAVEVARQGLDLQVRHEPLREVDLDRFEVFTRQLAVDAAAEEAGGARGTAVILGLILDRVEGAGEPSGESRVRRLRRTIEEVLAAIDRGDFTAVARGAQRLDRILDR